MPPQPTDLVPAVLGGEPGAFAALHSRYHGRIYAFALKRLRDPDEAEDVTQDVFIQVFRCLSGFEGRSSLLTWMFGIAHNLSCKRLQKRRVPTVSLDMLEADPPAEKIPADERLDADRVLQRVFDTLEQQVSPERQEIFRRYYLEMQSQRAIGESLGIASAAVKASLFRTRSDLRAHVAGLSGVLNRA